MLTTIGIAIALFVSTNIDDIFVLLGLFADREYRASEIVAGQYLGIAVLFGISVAASLLALSIPHPYTGLLGIVVIALGVKRMVKMIRMPTGPAEAKASQAGTVREHRHGQVAAVAFVTLANGGDNIIVYTPAFAVRSAGELAVTAVVFAIFTAIWCLIAHSAVNHPRVRTHIRHYGRLVSPFVFVAIGVVVMLQAGTLGFLLRLLR